MITCQIPLGVLCNIYIICGKASLRVCASKCVQAELERPEYLQVINLLGE